MESAAALGVSRRTFQSLLASGVLTPLQGSGGQGRAARFDPADVMAYRDNVDVSDALAACIAAWPHGLHPIQSTPFSSLYDRDGNNVSTTPASRVLRALRLYRPAPGIISKCRAMCCDLSRRQCEYLLAFLIASARPTLAHGCHFKRGQTFKRIDPDVISKRHRRSWDGGKRAPCRFWHDFNKWIATVPADSTLLELIRNIHAAPEWKAMPPHVRRALTSFRRWSGGRYSWRYIKAINKPRIRQYRTPAAADVGRLLGVSREYSAAVWRELRPRVPEWFMQTLFE